MAIPQKVNSSSGYIFRQPRGYHTNVSQAKSFHPATHRNGTPGAGLYRNHRHNLFQSPQTRKWASPKSWTGGIVHKKEQFCEREGKAGRTHSNLADPNQRSKKPSPRDFCPKGETESPHPKIRAQDREVLKCFHRFPVCTCYICTTGLFGRKEVRLLWKIHKWNMA